MPEFLEKKKTGLMLPVIAAALLMLPVNSQTLYAGSDSDTKDATSESLLEAEGNWNLVEENSAYDPAQAHKEAREKVNPRSRNVNAELSPHFSPDAKSGQDGKIRVLKLQPGSEIQEDTNAWQGYDVAETSISKPASKVVLPEIAGKINAIFGEKPETEPDSGVENPVNLPAVPAPAAKEAVKKDKAEEKSGFFGRIASVFSPDEGKIVPPPENFEPVVLAEPGEEPKKVRLLAPKPLRIDGVVHEEIAPPPEPDILSAQNAEPIKTSAVAVKGIPVPRQVPARKIGKTNPLNKSAVIIASEFSAQKTKSGAQDVMSMDVAQSGKVHSIGMRAAAHPAKTRIAFDFSGAVKYKVAIDHIRNVLRIKFENTSWDQDEQGVMDKNSKLLGSYVVRKQKDGSILFEVRLKEKSGIKDTMILRPGVSPHHRVVVDLKN